MVRNIETITDELVYDLNGVYRKNTERGIGFITGSKYNNSATHAYLGNNTKKYLNEDEEVKGIFYITNHKVRFRDKMKLWYVGMKMKTKAFFKGEKLKLDKIIVDKDTDLSHKYNVRKAFREYFLEDSKEPGRVSIPENVNKRKNYYDRLIKETLGKENVAPIEEIKRSYMKNGEIMIDPKGFDFSVAEYLLEKTINKDTNFKNYGNNYRTYKGIGKTILKEMYKKGEEFSIKEVIKKFRPIYEIMEKGAQRYIRRKNKKVEHLLRELRKKQRKVKEKKDQKPKEEAA